MVLPYVNRTDATIQYLGKQLPKRIHENSARLGSVKFQA